MGAASAIRGGRGKRGLLVVGHGTRDERGLAEFQAVAEQVRRLASEFAVEACYLEIAQPDIATGVGRLLEQGATELAVAPLLLFAAGHALVDIPKGVEEAVRGRGENAECGMRNAESEGGWRMMDGGNGSGVVVRYLPALECQERVLELSARRFEEGVTGGEVDLAETMLLMIGRGSSYPTAIAEMRRFAELRTKRTPVGQIECAFVAIARPTLAEGLQLAVRSKFRTIVVQPHLLFEGQVLDEIRREVAEIAAGEGSGKEWIVTPHLGPSEMVAEAVLELARSAEPVGSSATAERDR